MIKISIYIYLFEREPTSKLQTFPDSSEISTEGKVQNAHIVMHN